MRNYKRKRGTRSYLTAYSEEQMDGALKAVKDGLTFYKAAKQFKVPKSTLIRKFSGQRTRNPGGQNYLSQPCEMAIVFVLNQLVEWKVPLTLMELRLLVKNYLDLRGIVDSKFTDNFPGRDWARGFLKRHGLILRFASKIKPNRCNLSREKMDSYFFHLGESLTGVEPSQIFNFDETNFTDDPTRKKCIIHRGVNRVERLTVYSKQAFSVMFCGSAVGVYLPPMVVYKAKHMYSGWSCDGITGAVYGATESGWFDMASFEKWFFEVFLVHVKDLAGPKVLIGDNLSSHFSPAVIESCIGHNIRFVPLPPNSTHLCQPLDVAVFRPMKMLWGATLSRWRVESRFGGTIPKETFPRLLARVFAVLDGKNLVAGFKASGIVPLESNEVIKRLPGGNSVSTEIGGVEMLNVLNEACLSILRDHCGVGPSTSKVKGRRGKKVTPGKAMDCVSDVTNHVETWVCAFCEEEYKFDDNRWIVCDKCDKAFHLQCSGVIYRARVYYDVDIENMKFLCEACE